MRVKKSLNAAGLAIVGTPALLAGALLAQQGPPVFDDTVNKRLAEQIQRGGASCPEIRETKFIGADDRGNIMRLKCGVIGGPAIEEPTFRLYVTFRGEAQISIWRD